MAKKFGSLVFLAAVAGAAAGVVSYLYKYQKFSEEVDQDFTDVVDSAMEVKDSAKRSYTILKDSRTKDAYKAVREAFDKKKNEFMDDEESVDSEDVDVEFYYDDDVVDRKEDQEDRDESVGEADTEKPEESSKEEGSGLVVTEEV